MTRESGMRRAMSTAGTFLLLAFSSGCASDVPETNKVASSSGENPCSEEDRSVAEASARKSFDRLYRKLQRYRRSWAVQISSRTEDHNDCEAFRKIVARGEDFLPFIVEKIEEGDFFLNQAMREITGVDVRAFYPDEKTVGEQSASRLWVRWWQERRLRRDEDQPFTEPGQLHP